MMVIEPENRKYANGLKTAEMSNILIQEILILLGAIMCQKKLMIMLNGCKNVTKIKMTL
nr:MAG TPA: hypothetical protein [Bacteriophage sp.]